MTCRSWLHSLGPSCQHAKSTIHQIRYYTIIIILNLLILLSDKLLYAFCMNGLIESILCQFGSFLIMLCPPFEEGVCFDLIRVVGEDTAALGKNLIEFLQGLEVLIDDGLVGQRP